MKNKYNDKVKLLYMDTDSLIKEIKTKDFQNDVKKSTINEFGTSDFSKDNVYGIQLVNKNVLGRFKDELNEQTMENSAGRCVGPDQVWPRSGKRQSKSFSLDTVLTELSCFVDYVMGLSLPKLSRGPLAPSHS